MIRNARKRFPLVLISLSLLCVWTGYVVAAPPSKPPCGTNGPLGVTPPSPSTHSYIRTTPGGFSDGQFTVSSPPIQTTGSCDSILPPVFGNGSAGSILPVAISIAEVTDTSDASLVGEPLLTVIKNAFAFTPTNFSLTNPGTGSQPITFSFTNSASIDAGVYDVTISAKPQAGSGVGEKTVTFTLTVTEFTAVDTLPPDVSIVAPTSGSKVLINGIVPVEYTAKDPEEDGAGTGVTAVSGSLSSAGGTVSGDITYSLSISPSLPVAAGVLVTAQTDLLMTSIGNYTFTAEATDGASHIGSASSSFSVGANVTPLPPISVPGRQFKAGSTVPVKWQITDANGGFLLPYFSIKVRITSPCSGDFTAVAGDGAGNIRWEQEYVNGPATQYIVNFPIPSLCTYRVGVIVNDVDNQEFEIGNFSFTAATKGGKQ